MDRAYSGMACRTDSMMSVARLGSSGRMIVASCGGSAVSPGISFGRLSEAKVVIDPVRSSVSKRRVAASASWVTFQPVADCDPEHSPIT